VLRPAVTNWELIGQSDTHAYLKLFPKTGRTHQIRVHLKSIGHPIVGDQLYASSEYLKKDSLGFSRMALHAHSLAVALPSGESMAFLAPLPVDFENASTAIASA